MNWKIIESAADFFGTESEGFHLCSSGNEALSSAIFGLAAQKHSALVILDAVQAAARLEPSKWAAFCDIFCISGNKIYAPKETALL